MHKDPLIITRAPPNNFSRAPPAPPMARYPHTSFCWWHTQSVVIFSLLGLKAQFLFFVGFVFYPVLHLHLVFYVCTQIFQRTPRVALCTQITLRTLHITLRTLHITLRTPTNFYHYYFVTKSLVIYAMLFWKSLCYFENHFIGNHKRATASLIIYAMLFWKSLCYFESHFIVNHKRATVVSHTTLVNPLSHTYGFSYNIYVKLNMNILLETIRELLWFHIQH